MSISHNILKVLAVCVLAGGTLSCVISPPTPNGNGDGDEVMGPTDDEIKTGLGLTQQAIKPVKFPYAEDAVQPKEAYYLQRWVDIFNGNGLNLQNASLKIRGYTDSVGFNESNLALSRKRANAVKKWLVSRGIQKERIEAEGYGKKNPACNETRKSGKALEECRQQNRRVEIDFITH